MSKTIRPISLLIHKVMSDLPHITKAARISDEYDPIFRSFCGFTNKREYLEWRLAWTSALQNVAHRCRVAKVLRKDCSAAAVVGMAQAERELLRRQARILLRLRQVSKKVAAEQWRARREAEERRNAMARLSA